ncbi:sperm mitochondrial-associated cysteine-rich protein-like [Diabrotica virgifera virgifera]|uniref:Sperm mitochondrial-associated cysteine-rich protein-like n=1 Tax=Diabrotica virgifera virgifera TaxID=50390 RepID=A0A6P7FGL8_DIAVI|nr:sperm mitochondrial-associated cysteine-rich protein-like [Diabrotica virgifera virgifera]
MKNFVVLIVLSFLLVVVLQVEAIRECPPNSHSGCKPCCPDPTCTDRTPTCPPKKPCKELSPPKCQLQCRCNPSHIMNKSTGVCVMPMQCPRPPVGN